MSVNDVPPPTARAEIEVRAARASDQAVWRKLWLGYCDSYGEAVAEDATAAAWERIVSSDDRSGCVIALRDSVATGFANYTLHAITLVDGSGVLLGRPVRCSARSRTRHRSCSDQ